MDSQEQSAVEVPRTLFLTWWPPDMPYQIIWKIAERFPRDRLMWCFVQRRSTEHELEMQHRRFPADMLHWRLRSTWLQYVYTSELQAGRLAGEIASFARQFAPDVIWALSEMGICKIAPRVAEHLDVPLHVTIHDAHEWSKHSVPALFYPFYIRSARKMLCAADSVDAVTDQLIDHAEKNYGADYGERRFVFPPSVETLPESVKWRSNVSFDGVRKIGICGSMRISQWQLQEMVDLFGTMPFEIEIVAFAYTGLFPPVNRPANVKVSLQPWAETERDIIDSFQEQGVHACYLGLWREEKRALFGDTSLSAKLTTYAQAGIPVIVDARESSVAWKLVSKYDAGILLRNSQETEADASDRLREMLTDSALWQKRADGAERLCCAEFDINRNFQRFAELLAATAARPES